MSYLFATISIVAGAILMSYSVGTFLDPYWQSGTRVMGFIGTIVGFAAVLLGMWSVTW